MDRQRLADALAYEQERRKRLASVVPMPADGQPEVAPTPSLRSNVENLSIGLGEGLTNQLEGVRALVTDPIGSAKGAYEAVRGVVRDPSVIAQALREMGSKAASGPLGAGEVVGEMLGPMRGRPAPDMLELDVYHGTPHRFPATEANPLGEFDASKIGTGEGAQAYGHGVYLAESPDVAKSYRFKQLTGDIVFKDGTKINVLNLPKDSPEKLAAQIWLTNPNLKEATTFVQEIKKEKWKKDHPNWENPQQQVLQELKKLNDKGAELGGGSLYKADLPDQLIDRMMDWDKPLSEQPAAVQKALRELAELTDEESTARGLLSYSENPKASTVYKAIGASLPGVDTMASYPGSAQLSNELAKRGIPGIKYLDAGSRNQGGSGTRNFVVFPGEEKKVKILERK